MEKFSLETPVRRPLSRPVSKTLIYVMLVLVTASWGAVLPILRQVNLMRESHGLSAWDIVWLRLVPGAVCFLPVLMARRAICLKLLREAWFPVLLVGLCTTSLYNYFLVTGEERVPAPIASLIIGVNPSTAFALSVIFLGERATWRKIVGMVLSLIGLIYISQSERSASGEAVEPYYLAMTVMAPVVFSFGTIISKRMLKDIDPLTITASTVVAGAIPLLPLPWLQGNLIGAAPDLPFSFWAAVAFLVLVPLVIGYLVWYMALERLDAGQVSAFIFLVPVFGVALSAFTEPPTMASLFGGVVILAGVLLTNSNPTQTRGRNTIGNSSQGLPHE